MNVMPCPTCQGGPPEREALFVRINGKNICDLTAKTIKDALAFFAEIALTEKEAEIAGAS